jgi:predicted acetyltransferase
MDMAWLSEPVPDVRESFLAAMAEFGAEGRGRPDDHSALGDEMREFGAGWATPAGFGAYVAWLRAESTESARRPAGWVPWTARWWVDGDGYLGRIQIRHRLTERLLEWGGHIGYDMRPSARRQGHATAMLAAALPVAAGLGIDRALLTCDADNVASRRVIEANGGGYEDERGGKLRFWVPTGRRAAASA